ncbi:MAG: ABC transporter permease, partial [Acidobacteria bacterium]|nr:ABC transporter permease [Acidobacteriota bacterium]
MKPVVSFYTDALRIALQSIFAHKLRSFLTLIGIIIGVASVVVVGASISGLNSYVVAKVEKVLGANHFMISRMAHHGEMTEEEWVEMSRRNKRLTWDDYEWLKSQCESCSEVGAQLDTTVDLNQDGIEMKGVEMSGV